MTIKIIGAGYGRTGTMSTKEALNMLGYPCYHMDQVILRKNKGHAKFWWQVANTPAGSPHQWQQVFEDYSATVDFPSSCVWQELMRAYPNAKVLLTVHPGGPEAWYKSTVDTIYSFMTRWEFRALRTFEWSTPKLLGMIEKLIWQRTLRNTMSEKSAALQQYQAHIDEVIAAVPAEKLLVFSVDQGWQPLCDFLGVAVPDQDFPRVNDTAQIKRMINTGAWVIKGLMLLGVMVLAVSVRLALAAG